MDDTKRVTVIGAGIVGVISAILLRRDGHDVTLVDRDEPGEGCSFGNAGLIARSSIVPLADTGTFLRVPGWLLDPNGPLSIRWRYLPRLTPWLWRFVYSGLFDDAYATAEALQFLTDPSLDLYEALAQDAGCADLIRRTDYLYVYRSERAFRKDAGGFQLRRDLGVTVDELTAGEIKELEPELSPLYRFAYRLPDHGFVLDPGGFVKKLVDHFRREGGNVVRADVDELKPDDDGRMAWRGEGGEGISDVVVIAAGAFSARLTSSLGVSLPLETERGYHVTLPHSTGLLTRPVMEGHGKFLAAPMAMGLRFAGTVELGGLEAPPSEKRLRGLLESVRRMVPSVSIREATTWMGHRPSFPDSLPVIGGLPGFPNVFLAFGHQHIGLTSAPKTAGIVTDLVAGRTPNTGISAFRADRFHNSATRRR